MRAQQTAAPKTMRLAPAVTAGGPDMVEMGPAPATVFDVPEIAAALGELDAGQTVY